MNGRIIKLYIKTNGSEKMNGNKDINYKFRVDEDENYLIL